MLLPLLVRTIPITHSPIRPNPISGRLQATLDLRRFGMTQKSFTNFRVTLRVPGGPTVRTGSGESGVAVAAGIEGTGRKLDAATRTGDGEAGSVAAAGYRGGTGTQTRCSHARGFRRGGQPSVLRVSKAPAASSMQPRARVPASPGSAVAAGIEGTGYRVAAGITVGAGEHGSVVAAGIEGTGQARGGQYQDIILLASDMDQDTATIKRWTLSTPIRVDDFLAPSGEGRWLQRAMGSQRLWGRTASSFGCSSGNRARRRLGEMTTICLTRGSWNLKP